ncbi:MAG: hypothetical protein RL757_289 [Bacteroidota bacterium]|jgi:hypothetical protein
MIGTFTAVVFMALTVRLALKRKRNIGLWALISLLSWWAAGFISVVFPYLRGDNWRLFTILGPLMTFFILYVISSDNKKSTPPHECDPDILDDEIEN